MTNPENQESTESQDFELPPVEVKPEVIPDIPLEDDIPTDEPMPLDQEISTDEALPIDKDIPTKQPLSEQLPKVDEDAPKGLKALFKPPLYKNKFVIISGSLILLIVLVSIIAFSKNNNSIQETKSLITPTAFPSTTVTETPTATDTTTPIALETEYSVFSNDFVSFKYPKTAQASVETTDSFLTDNIYLVGVRGVNINAKGYQLKIYPVGGMGWGSYKYDPLYPTQITLLPEGGDSITYTLDKSVKRYTLSNNLNAISVNINGKNHLLMNYLLSDGLSIEESRNLYFESSGITVWRDKEFKFIKGFDNEGIEKSYQYDAYMIDVNFKSNTEAEYAQFVQDFNQLMNSYKFLR